MASFLAANMNPLNYFGGVSFVPDKDIPDLSGKVILVTGGRPISYPVRSDKQHECGDLTQL